MILTQRKNEYGHDIIDCPFCDGWVYLRGADQNKDPLRDLKRHIVHTAKSEAFELNLNTEEENRAHLDYVIMHYSWKPQRNGTLKRQFDNDLEI